MGCLKFSPPECFKWQLQKETSRCHCSHLGPMVVPEDAKRQKRGHLVLLFLSTWTCPQSAVTQQKDSAGSGEETFQLAFEERALMMWKCVAIN